MRMSASPSAALPALRNHLSPELVAYLERHGDLPAAVRASLAGALRHMLAAYAAYIPAPIVRSQLADPAPGRVRGSFWDGTLLFADLSGFTRLCAHLSILGKQGAEEVSTVINRLFDALVDEVHGRRGTLLKFGGDALTAFFGDDTPGAGHAVAATSTALSLQDCMARFTNVQTRAGTFRLGLRVGVHSGRLFAAEVGDRDHIELVISGHAVNRVAMAQDIAAPGAVVISDQTATLLAASEQGTHAQLVPRARGFQHIRALPEITPAAASDDPIVFDDADDLATLERLALQVAALRPYLVRNLPRRFLAIADRELGEFRPVSVLFANFSGFSRLLDLLGDDAGRATTALNSYFHNAQAIVHRYNGIVNKVDMHTHGDKLMALFGAPVVHEDEPLLAVRCALELQATLDQVNTAMASLLTPAEVDRLRADVSPDPHTEQPAVSHLLRQKIGINSGTVFAGRVGGARRHEYTVVGPEVNLAARLMAAADDGTILISPATHAAVAAQVAVADHPPLHLKGLDAPVEPGRVLHVLETPHAPTAKVASGLHRPTMVGRDTELAHLTAEATGALHGTGRVLALVGEAGTGKTRLSQELLQQLQIQTGTGAMSHYLLVSGDCQSYDRHTPYGTLRRPLRQLLGLGTPHGTADAHAGTEFMEHLQTRVEQLAAPLVRFTALLGDILGSALPETALTRSLTAEQRRDRVQELLVALFLGTASRSPLLLFLDDLQWADSASLELLNQITHAIAGSSTLVLLNYRPEPPIAEPWSQQAATTRLVLHELPRESCIDLLQAMLGAPPPPGLSALLDRTQGNPLFIEELVYALVDAGELVRDTTGAWQIRPALDQNAVPDRIETLLRARIDRLDEPSYELVQVASVIGRRFHYPLIAGVYNHTTPLDHSLQHLIQCEVILVDQPEHEPGYLFRHALLRDVVYEGILYARRRELHRRVAGRIEELAGANPEEHLALLAWHYLQAEAWQPAFRYHLAAGAQAQERYAHHDALALLNTALTIVPHLSIEAGPGTFAAPIVELYERIGIIYELLGEYDQSQQAHETALATLAASDTPDIPTLVRLHRLLAVVQERRSDYQGAFDWLERGMARATAAAREELARCYLLGAGMYRRQGEYQRSLEWARIGLRLSEQIDSRRDQAAALKLLGGTYLALGDNARALEFIRRALHLYEQVQDMVGLADAHNDLAITYQGLGQLDQARRHFESGAAIKEAVGDVFGQAMIANNLGELLRILDDLDEAVQQYQHSLTIFERIGSRYASGVLHMNLGATYLLHDDLIRAERHLRNSGTFFEEAGTDEFLPELERYCADLYLRRGDLVAAQEACNSALHTAARLQARAEEGMTRRLLGQIRARNGDLSGAWEQFAQSRLLLQESAHPHELARTLLSIAEHAPALGQHAEGADALRTALPILRTVGARRDIAIAEALALRHGYDVA